MGFSVPGVLIRPCGGTVSSSSGLLVRAKLSGDARKNSMGRNDCGPRQVRGAMRPFMYGLMASIESVARRVPVVPRPLAPKGTGAVDRESRAASRPSSLRASCRALPGPSTPVCAAGAEHLSPGCPESLVSRFRDYRSPHRKRKQNPPSLLMFALSLGVAVAPSKIGSLRTVICSRPAAAE